MNYELLYPELIVSGLILLLIVLDLMLGKGKKDWLPHAASIGIFAVFLFVLFYKSSSGISFWDTIGELDIKGFVFDRFALFFKMVFLLIAFIIVSLSINFFRNLEFGYGEFYPLLLCVVLGMMFMVSATELVLLFVAIELTSIPLYILAAYKGTAYNLTGYKRSGNFLSSEAGIKYFLLGALASALLLFGMSLIYAGTGTTYLSEIQKQITRDVVVYQPALFIGFLFVMGGLAFKIAAAPFHMWAPDVYEGAPSPVVAFLSVAPKCAGIAVLIRFFIAFFPSLLSHWTFLFAVLSVASMIIGNLMALHQENVKRMLAYSGIAQIGYALIGLVSVQQGNITGLEGSVFYLIVYAVTNITAFGVIIYLSVTTGKGEFVADFKGLGTRYPWLALVMLISLLSLAGVPPLAGFIGKFYLFMGAVKSSLTWLAVLGVINSVISLFYYLRVAKAMYLEEPYPHEAGPVALVMPLRVVLWVTLIAIVVLGIYPQPLTNISIEIFKRFLYFPLS